MSTSKQTISFLENTSNNPPVKQTIRPRIDTTLPAQWSYLCHRATEGGKDEIDGYFLENWKFTSFKASHLLGCQVLRGCLSLGRKEKIYLRSGGSTYREVR
jgi:hypothetical protein